MTSFERAKFAEKSWNSVKQKLCVSLFAEDRNTQQEEWEKKEKGLYQRK